MTMNVSDEEMVAEIERQIAAGTDLDGLIPVKSSVPRSPRAVFSIRLAPEELKAISEAARAQGVSIGDFLREAARHAIARVDEPDTAADDYSVAAFQADLARLSRKLERSLARQEEQLRKGA